MSERLFVKGNEAICLGALAAGCRAYFGYPITPQNDVPEYLSTALPAVGGAFVQAESELAAVSMLMGAGAAGVRAMTSSSSPGVSLMQEALSYMAGSGIPGVIVNVTRGGPGLGDIGTSQGDYFQATRGGGHGDYRTFVLAPASCQEAYDMTTQAFCLAFRYRAPILILADAIVGQMKEPLTPRPASTPTTSHPDEAADWALTGAGGRPPRLLKSLYLEPGALAARNRELAKTYEAMRAHVDFESFHCADAELVVVAFGSIGRIVKSAIRTLREQGRKVGLFRPKTLFPFPDEELARLASQGKRFLTVEQNLGQMVDDVRLAVRCHADSDFFGFMPGDLPTPDDFLAPIAEALALPNRAGR